MAAMAHGHAWPFQGHLVWPWKGQRAPEIDAKRCLSAPDPGQQNQKVVTDCAPSPRHRTAPIGAVCLLSLKREQDFQSTARQTQNSSILGMRATRAHGAFVVFLLF